jgi:hypothetical protein
VILSITAPIPKPFTGFGLTNKGVNKMSNKFKEIIGNASTTASRNGKLLGHNVNATSYIKDDGNILVSLESGGSSIGVPSKIMTQTEYEEWKDSCPSGLHLMLHGLRLFGCTTSFDA